MCCITSHHITSHHITAVARGGTTTTLLAAHGFVSLTHNIRASSNVAQVYKHDGVALHERLTSELTQILKRSTSISIDA